MCSSGVPVRSILVRSGESSLHVGVAQIIQESGIKYTCKIKPHSCPLHDDGPVWELQLKEVQLQLSNQTLETARAHVLKLQQRQRELTAKVTRYHKHLEQYQVCRAAVQEAEAALQYGDGKCVLFRDFVNDYNEKGQKVKNLVLVKETRAQNGELCVEKLHNFCSDTEAGCDSYFVADVFDHHLKSKANGGSGFFDGITSITLSGDHGPHFASVQTMYNETLFWKKYGKTVVLKFLCSYHAYNRCDGAGACVKLEAAAAAKNNCGPLSAGDYATLMNTTNHAETYAFTFVNINRGADVFPKLAKVQGIKKFCEVVFAHADTDGDLSAHTAGVILARNITGVGALTVFDLAIHPKDWGRLCKDCTSTTKRPVYHTKEQTKCAATVRSHALVVADRKQREILVNPDPARISGPQVARKQSSRERSGVGRGGEDDGA
jgi:hypothetical protein